MNPNEDMKYQDQRVDCHCNGLSTHRYTCNQEQRINCNELMEPKSIDHCTQNGQHIH